MSETFKPLNIPRRVGNEPLERSRILTLVQVFTCFQAVVIAATSEARHVARK